MQTRKTNGQYGRKSYILNILIVGVIALMSYGAYLSNQSPVVYVNEAAKTIVKEAKAERNPDRLDKAIAKMKRDVVLKIQKLESGGYEAKEGELFYTHDSAKSLRAECTKTGGKRNLECESWGSLQMKIPTIQLWYKQLGKGDISEKDAMLLALDNDKALEFAEEVIFTIRGSVFAWTTAVAERTWFDYQINLIRELEAEK